MGNEDVDSPINRLIKREEINDLKLDRKIYSGIGRK